MVDYLLLSETDTKRKQTSNATFFIPSIALDILFMMETTIICKPLHIITSCLKSILHRTSPYYIWARKLYEILLIQLWALQHTDLIHLWIANKIKPNKSTLGKKPKNPPCLCFSTGYSSSIQDNLCSLTVFLFISGVNRLEHRSSLWQWFLTVEVYSISQRLKINYFTMNLWKVE